VARSAGGVNDSLDLASRPRPEVIRK